MYDLLSIRAKTALKMPPKKLGLKFYSVWENQRVAINKCMNVALIDFRTDCQPSLSNLE